MPFKNFWEFLNTDISKFSSIAVSGGQLVVDFVETLKENLNQKKAKVAAQNARLLCF